MPLSPQLQKLCQQAEQEKDFRKLLSPVPQINHLLKSQPQPSKDDAAVIHAQEADPLTGQFQTEL